MRCCGECVETRYCPHCGKEVGGERPLRVLLLHCRKQLKMHRAKLAGDRKWVKEYGEGKASARVEHGEARVAEWSRLVEALEEVVDVESGGADGAESAED